MEKEGAIASASLNAFVKELALPRVIWMMVPAAAVDEELTKLLPLLKTGDIIVDGGNSHYVDDLRRAATLKAKGIHHVDVGASDGVWGLEQGFCLMIGGERGIVKHLDPIFVALAPGVDAAPRGRPAAIRSRAPPSRDTFTAVQTAPATSSKWCITVSSTG